MAGRRLQLYRYAGSAGVIALLSEILCALFIVIVTILEFIRMYRRRLDYFRDVWNVFQWTAIILFYIAVGVYVMRCLWTVTVIEDLMNNPGNTHSYCSCQPRFAG